MHLFIMPNQNEKNHTQIKIMANMKKRKKKYKNVWFQPQNLMANVLPVWILESWEILFQR